MPEKITVREIKLKSLQPPPPQVQRLAKVSAIDSLAVTVTVSGLGAVVEFGECTRLDMNTPTTQA